MGIANTHRKANVIKCNASIKLLKLVYRASTLFPSLPLLCHHRRCLYMAHKIYKLFPGIQKHSL